MPMSPLPAGFVQQATAAVAPLGTLGSRAANPGDTSRQRRPSPSATEKPFRLVWLLALGLALGMPQLVQSEVITVKLLVDEEERMTTVAWQARLKSRLDKASDIISQYCNIRFAVAEFGTWESDNRITDLSRTLRELEQEVDPGPAQIAIGFSSQYRFRKGINGLGGTRGPLHTHILLRESSPHTLEPERLEALLHELGHFLGAAHSSDPKSVMRPVIGDGRARSNQYQLGFDPVNARIIRFVGSEVSILGIRRFHQLSTPTKQRLIDQYQQLAQQLPSDPAAKKFLEFLEQQVPGAGAP